MSKIKNGGLDQYGTEPFEHSVIFVNENENETKTRKQKTIENENEKLENKNENGNAKRAKLVTQRKCQHTIRRLRVLWPYGIESVTNGGRYLG